MLRNIIEVNSGSMKISLCFERGAIVVLQHLGVPVPLQHAVRVLYDEIPVCFNVALPVSCALQDCPLSPLSFSVEF